MKIDNQKLIELLAAKAEMDPKTVEAQLNQLIARIRDAAEKGKALEIKGFGMFYFSEAGDLKFDPSEEFQTEVNYKYTGMQPVEIKKPRESTEPSQQLSGESKPGSGKANQNDIRGVKSGTDQTGDKIEPDPEERQKDETRSSDKEDEKADHPEKKSKETYDTIADFDKSSEKADEGTKDKVSQEGTSEPVSGEPSPDFPGYHVESTTERSKSVPDGAKSKKKSARKPEKRKRNPGTILIASIAAVLVIVIGFLMIGDIGVFSDNDSSQEVNQNERPSPAPMGADLETGPETEEQQELEEEPGEQEQPELSRIEEGETSSFGLHGTTQSIEGRYYSIILHSLRSENRAEELRGELQDQGYRAVITSVNTEEYGTMWRVGIGQFESIPDAQDAATELPQNYRDNHFIGLLQ